MSRDYYPTQDPRVSHVLDLMTEALVAASREKYADDYMAAMERTATAQSALQFAIYDLARELVNNGEQVTA